MSGDLGRVGAGPIAVGPSGPDRPSAWGADKYIISGRAGLGSLGPAAIVLDLSAGPPDLRIAVTGRDGDTLLSLGPFGEPDVIAIWRSMVDSSGLLPMIRSTGSSAEAVARQIGRLRLGPVRPTIRYAVLNDRRPRFLVRRKGSRLPVRPVVHAKAEIAAGTGA